MRVVTLLNAAAGPEQSASADEQARQVQHAFEAARVQAEVRPVRARELTTAAREAASSDVDAVVVGGGDGTISSVAGILAGSQMPLGVLPLGTLNHFAKDAGIPQMLEEAVQVIAAGAWHAVDVADVNGRVFTNNSSIGIYPRIVSERDQQRQRLGRGKWRAMLSASVSVFRRFPTVRVRLGIGDRSVPCTTPFVFVGNNRYEFSLLQFGGRTALDRGELGLYYPLRTGRLGLLKLAARAVLGRLDQAKDFAMMSLPEVWIESPRRQLHVAVDGELVYLPPPLHYRIRPRALRLLAPAARQ